MKVKTKQSRRVPTKAERFELAGLPEVERPSFLHGLRLPDDLSALDLVGLSRLLGRFTQAYGYASSVRAKADLRIIEMEAAMQSRRTQICNDSPSIVQMEKHRRDTLMVNDEEISRSLRVVSEQRQTREWAYCMVAVFDKAAAAVSRELTRKMSITGTDYSDVGKIRRRR